MENTIKYPEMEDPQRTGRKISALSIVNRKITLITSFLIILVIFIYSFLSSNNKTVKEGVDVNSITPVDSRELVTEENVKRGYVKLNLKSDIFDIHEIEEDQIFRDAGRTVHILYFPEGQNIRVPSFLSDYEFISVHNHHNSPQNYGLGITTLTRTLGKKLEKVELTNISVNKYQRGNEYWATAGLKPENYSMYGDINTYFLFHSKTLEGLDELIDLANRGIEISDYYFNNKFEEIIPERIKVSPNYTISNGKYSLYVSNGYKPSMSNQDNLILQSDKNGSNMCIALKEISGEPCGFSTSGCTCCN